MSNLNLFHYVKKNYKFIHDNIKQVFELEDEEVQLILSRIISLDPNDPFYKDSLNLDTFLVHFEIDNLNRVKRIFNELSSDKELAKQTLIYTPFILLFSEKPENIFFMCKDSDIKGYTIIHNNEFKSYNCISRLPKSIRDANNYDESNYENAFMVNSMLQSLQRKDVQEYYGIDENSTLEQKFYALSSNHNKRNYYFYKKRNPLLGVKALLSTLNKDDGKFHCDVCNSAFNSTDDLYIYHIKPLDNGGDDELYNISCLCSSCYDKAKKYALENASQTELIDGLKRRIKENFPDYINKVNSYFNQRSR